MDYQNALNTLINRRGHGGAFSVAIDLDADPSSVSRWRRGSRPIPARIGARIAELHAAEVADLIPPSPDLDSPDDLDNDLDDSDPPAGSQIPASFEDLESAVLEASADAEYYLPSEDSRPSQSQAITVTAEWRNQVWLPINEMVAGYIGPPNGELIVKQSKSGHGDLACQASERCAKRAGLDNIMTNGHWLADLAIMASYAVSCLKIARMPRNAAKS